MMNNWIAFVAGGQQFSMNFNSIKQTCLSACLRAMVAT
ncbi:hypothetical protein FHS15_001826 [Paenibacillus castaneae]|nr:hypothetical protein [Paenibacillus castaneae]